MARAATTATEEFDTVELKRESVTYRILGRTPLIINRMSEKAKREIILGGRPKSRAERASTLKHEPVKEFRASAYRMRETDSSTLLGFPAMCFKNAMASAAVDMPGAAKAQIGRLVYVEGNLAPIWGNPQLFMAVVRQAGMTRAPDIRTRAILPNWATEIEITFATPLIREKQVGQLIGAAGIIQGVGDWRPEKGKGNYGQFEIVDAKDQRWHAVVANGARSSQVAALETPVCYDLETEELLEWYNEEVERRGFVISDGEEEDEDAELELAGVMSNGRVHVMDAEVG